MQSSIEVSRQPAVRYLLRIGDTCLIQAQRLADQVERHVGHRDVLLEHRPVPAPFGQALGLEQAGVADAEQVAHGRLAGDFDRGLHEEVEVACKDATGQWQPPARGYHMWSTDFGSS